MASMTVGDLKRMFKEIESATRELNQAVAEYKRTVAEVIAEREDKKKRVGLKKKIGKK